MQHEAKEIMFAVDSTAGDTDAAACSSNQHADLAICNSTGGCVCLRTDVLLPCVSRAFAECCACTGAGAVHKSPELLEGEARLLLTVDDACC